MNPDEIARQKAKDDRAKKFALKYLEKGAVFLEDLDDGEWESTVPKNVRERVVAVRAGVEKNDPKAKVERQRLTERLNDVGARGLNQEIEAASKKSEKTELDRAILEKNKERKDLFQKGFLMAVASGAKNFDDAVKMVKEVYSPFIGGDNEEQIANDIREWISDSEWMEKAFLTPVAYKPLNRGLANTALKENLSVDEMDEMIKREAQYFARQKDVVGLDTYINPSNSRNAVLGNENSKWDTVRDAATFGPRLAGSALGYIGSAALDRLGFPNAALWLEEATAVDNPDKITNDITTYIPGANAGKVGRLVRRAGKLTSRMGGRLTKGSGAVTSLGDFFGHAGRAVEKSRTIPRYVGEGVADIAVQVPVDKFNEAAHGNVETGVGIGIGKGVSSGIEGGLHAVTSANPEYTMLLKRAKQAAKNKNAKRTVVNGADGEIETTGGIFTDGNGNSYIQTTDGAIHEYVPEPSEKFDFEAGKNPRTGRFKREFGTTRVGAEVPERLDIKTSKANAALLKWLKLNPSDLRKQGIDPDDLSILFEEGLIKPGDTPYDIALRVERKVDELDAQRSLAKRTGRADPDFLEVRVGYDSKYTADAISQEVNTRLAKLLDDGVIDAETYDKTVAKADEIIRRYFPDHDGGQYHPIRPMEIQGLINSFTEKENKFYSKLNTREARTPEELAEHEMVSVFKDVNRDLYDLKTDVGKSRLVTPEKRIASDRAQRDYLAEELKLIESNDPAYRKMWKDNSGPNVTEEEIDAAIKEQKKILEDEIRGIDQRAANPDLFTVEQNLVDEWKATPGEYSKWLGLNRAMQNKKGAWLNDSFGIHGTTSGNGVLANVPKSRAGLLKKGAERLWNTTMDNLVPVPRWSAIAGENFSGRPFTADDILKMRDAEYVFKPNVFENYGKMSTQEYNDEPYDMPVEEPRTVEQLFGDALTAANTLINGGAKKADEVVKAVKSGGVSEEAKTKAQQDLRALERKERVRREEPKGKGGWKRNKSDDEIRLEQKNRITQDELDFLNAVASKMGGYVDGRGSFMPGTGFTIE